MASGEAPSSPTPLPDPALSSECDTELWWGPVSWVTSGDCSCPGLQGEVGQLLAGLVLAAQSIWQRLDTQHCWQGRLLPAQAHTAISSHPCCKPPALLPKAAHLFSLRADSRPELASASSALTAARRRSSFSRRAWVSKVSTLPRRGPCGVNSGCFLGR